MANLDFSNLKGMVIPEGNVVKIAISGEIVWQAKTYTNLVQLNDTNTSDFSLWMNNARLGSDGTYRESANSDLTNYIELKGGETAYFSGTGITKNGNGATAGYVVAMYKQPYATSHLADNGGLKAEDMETAHTGAIERTFDENGNLTSITHKWPDEPPMYIRLVIPHTVDKNKVIITVNEEIT